ncbi:hypothetical protein DY000_02001593 [Brassica cretica]|nr:hypothetical protein DY000_02001593 [Brassica cretica]
MISDLPCELETEILSRVPPKCLAKLQTSCKRWYVLFKDPKFVKKNSDKAAKEVILHMDFRVHSMNFNLQGAHKGASPLMKSTGKLRYGYKIDDPKEVSWTKFLVEDCNKFGYPRYFEGMSFMVDEKNKVVVCCSRGIYRIVGGEHIYDTGEDLLRQIYKERICFSWLRPRLLIYVPSLAHIPKSKEEEKRGEAYDALDPTGNITIKWDIISWTADGYVAVVSIFNFQQYRHIQAPGWQLRGSWYKKEVIWSMVGAQATEQGDCSKFKGNIPHCCKKTPTVVDLLPGTPYNQHISNCCRGGVISSWAQDPATAVGRTTSSRSCNVHSICVPSEFIGM